MNKELATKSTKNFSLVPQMHSYLCIIYTAFVTRKIAEMLRKWYEDYQPGRFCQKVEKLSAFFNIHKNSFGYITKTLDV